MDHDWAVTVPGESAAPEVGDPHEFGSGVEPTGRPNAHLRKTAADMIRSMAVVLAVVFVIVLLAWRPSPDEVKVVDPAPVLARASAEAAFPITTPVGLPDAWRPTSARWEPSAESGDEPVLHIGYVTPTDQYAQFSQSMARSAGYLSEQTGEGRPVGTEDVNGVAWERLETKARRSLVMAQGEVLTIVSGSAPWVELETLAASLEPVAATG
jgi:hypothetical protein